MIHEVCSTQLHPLHPDTQRLGYGLAWSGGLNNTSVQLVEIDYDRVDQVFTLLTPLKKKLDEYFGRCNGIVYEVAETDDENKKLNSVDKVAKAAKEGTKFKFKVNIYSGLQPCQFEVTLGYKADKVAATVDIAGNAPIADTNDDDGNDDDEEGSNGSESEEGSHASDSNIMDFGCDEQTNAVFTLGSGEAESRGLQDDDGDGESIESEVESDSDANEDRHDYSVN